MNENSMIEDPNKIRRVINLCVFFTRNMAYYRASYDDSRYSAGDDDFSKTISGNFIDISIIEWCKLFGAWSEDHHWKKIFPGNAEVFKVSLLKNISMSNSEFSKYQKTMTNYRNVFAAHWDDNGEGKRPYLDTAFKCIVFLHKSIFTNIKDPKVIQDKVHDLTAYYETCFEEAIKCYQAIDK